MLYKVTRVARRDHEKSRGKKGEVRLYGSVRFCRGDDSRLLYDYYIKERIAYIFIALTPVVAWGYIIAVINLFGFFYAFDSLFRKWLYGYNLFRAAGDIYIIVKFSRFPKDILVISWCRHESVFSEPEKFLTSFI